MMDSQENTLEQGKMEVENVEETTSQVENQLEETAEVVAEHPLESLTSRLYVIPEPSYVEAVWSATRSTNVWLVLVVVSSVAPLIIYW